MLVILPRQERVSIGADLNGFVYEGSTGDEEVIGKHGYCQRNAEENTGVEWKWK